jgi:hypothetical protein
MAGQRFELLILGQAPSRPGSAGVSPAHLLTYNQCSLITMYIAAAILSIPAFSVYKRRAGETPALPGAISI